MDFLTKARQGYLEQAKAEPNSFFVDASQSKEQVAKQAKQHVLALLKNKQLL